MEQATILLSVHLTDLTNTWKSLQVATNDTQADPLRRCVSHLKVTCAAVPSIKRFGIPSICAPWSSTCQW